MSGGVPTNKHRPQHVWIDVTGSFGGAYTCAGVLLEWRRHATIPDKWEALVCYAESDAHGWSMVTRWLLAEHVRPA